MHPSAAEPEEAIFAIGGVPEVVFLLLVAHQHRLVCLAGGHPLQESLGGQLEPPVLDDGLHEDGLVPRVQLPAPEGEDFFKIDFRSDSYSHWVHIDLPGIKLSSGNVEQEWEN